MPNLCVLCAISSYFPKFWRSESGWNAALPSRSNCLDGGCSPRTAQRVAFHRDLRYLCLRRCQPGISSALSAQREARVGRVSAVTESGRSNSSRRRAALQAFCPRCVLKSRQRVGCPGRWERFCCWVTRRAHVTAETHCHDTTRTLTSFTDLTLLFHWCVWISDPDYTAEFRWSRTDQNIYLCVCFLTCSDLEFSKFW